MLGAICAVEVSTPGALVEMSLTMAGVGLAGLRVPSSPSCPEVLLKPAELTWLWLCVVAEPCGSCILLCVVTPALGISVLCPAWQSLTCSGQEKFQISQTSQITDLPLSCVV